MNRPKFLESIAGNPGLDRLKGFDVGKNTLKPIRVYERTGSTEDVGFGVYQVSFSIDHNLGKIPYVLGQVLIDGAFMPIPYADFTFSQYATFSNLTNKNITILVSTLALVGVSIKVYLLQESLI